MLVVHTPRLQIMAHMYIYLILRNLAISKAQKAKTERDEN